MTIGPDDAQIEKRIRDFIQDHYELSQRISRRSEMNLSPMERVESASDSSPEEYESLRAEADIVAQTHWVDPSRMSHSVQTYPPEHGPDLETIDAIKIDGDNAIVTVTYDPRNRYTRLYEYHVKRCGDTWKIARLLTLNPNTSIPEKSTVSLLGIPFSNAFDPGDICDLDISHAFQNGAILHGLSGYERVSVLEVGKVSFPSRRVVVHDPGSLDYCEPLALHVPIGPHPVTISKTECLVGAFRVHWGNLEDVIGYLPARQMRSECPYNVSADVANVAIGDAELVLRMNYNQRDRLWNEVHELILTATKNKAEGNETYTRFVGDSFVSVESGKGDGGYPCYVGINRNGEPLCLAVDFSIYGENETHTSAMTYDLTTEDGFLSDAFLNKFNLRVHVEKRDQKLVFNFKGEHHLQILLLGQDGEELAKATHSSEGRSRPDGMVYTLYLELPEDFRMGSFQFFVTRWRSDLEKGPDGKPRSVDAKQVPFYTRTNGPTLSDLIVLMKAVPHLIKIVEIVESEEAVEPFRVMGRPFLGQEHVEHFARGKNCRPECIGWDVAMQVLKKNGEILIDCGGIQLQSKLAVVLFEFHTGKIITAMAINRGR